jgi:hypothetical protein
MIEYAERMNLKSLNPGSFIFPFLSCCLTVFFVLFEDLSSCFSGSPFPFVSCLSFSISFLNFLVSNWTSLRSFLHSSKHGWTSSNFQSRFIFAHLTDNSNFGIEEEVTNQMINCFHWNFVILVPMFLIDNVTDFCN